VHESIRRPDERVELDLALPLAAPRWNGQVFQYPKRLRLHPTAGGHEEVFVYISAMERAGVSTLNEVQKVSYDVVSGCGKLAAASLQAV
jgi:cold shock protein